jgi:hypothetical protein
VRYRVADQSLELGARVPVIDPLALDHHAVLA